MFNQKNSKIDFTSKSIIKITPLKNILLLQFPVLQQFPLIHGMFLRTGGFSEGSFSSLNFGLNTKDNLNAVLKNHQYALSNLLAYPNQHTYLQQCHSNIVFNVTKDNYLSLKNQAGDGLITNEKNLTLISFHADCQATIIYDPMKHIVANIHAGWRGQILKNIYAKTIEIFVNKYNSLPKNLIACISPSLGPNHSEMLNPPNILCKNFSKHIIKPYYFNFWSIAKEQFISLGLLKKNIYIAKICTFEHSQYFYSFRRENVTGRHASIVCLNKR